MVYVIWNHEARAWWRPRSNGYTTDLAQAGRYIGGQAMLIQLNDILMFDVAIPYPVAKRRGPPRFHAYDGELSAVGPS